MPISHDLVDVVVRDLRTAFAEVVHDMWDGDTVNAAPGRLDEVKAFRELGLVPPSSQQIDYFTFKSMWTVGGRETFRYFLPRLLAAALEDPHYGWITDANVILPKLDEAGFDGWPRDQRETVVAAISLWARLRLEIEAEVADEWSSPDHWAQDLLNWAKAREAAQ